MKEGYDQSRLESSESKMVLRSNNGINTTSKKNFNNKVADLNDKIQDRVI